MKFSSFFSKLQEAPWYRLFLNPVIDTIENNSNVLDIGTGSGKMLEILAKEKNALCTGTDTDINMLSEAQLKLDGTTVALVLTEAGKPLPFKNKKFDYITICSVLFHLDELTIHNMLNEYVQLLNKNGKIIILTPTGDKNLITLSKHFFSIKNTTIYIWYLATKRKAKLWQTNQYIKKYTTQKKRNYRQETVMNGFATFRNSNYLKKQILVCYH